MGLISATLSSISTTLADQWKEYFYCEAMPSNVIVMKGQKRVSEKSSNTKGSDNIISKGSVVAVADGQCMIIVDQGKVAEICAEPGEFIYDSSTEPSVFAGGGLLHNIGETFKVLGKRIGYGGDTGKDQRVYYFNIKELMGFKYGTPSPVPFRVVDERAGIDIDISLRCFGEYSIRVTNPILFYTNVCGNVATKYTTDLIEDQMRTELLTSLQPALSRISEQGIRYSSLPGHTTEIAAALNDILSAEWRDKRGYEIISFGVSSVSADPEDEKMLKEMQKKAAYFDPMKLAAYQTITQSDAMQVAAANPAGAGSAMMGINMMGGNAAATNAADLMKLGMEMNAAKQAAAEKAAAENKAANTWTCPKCGAAASGNFCPECGTKKPEGTDGWTCPTCGTVNKGKFCSNCGAKKPAGVPQYKCDKCGWEPEDKTNPPKFCPECGDPFDNNDLI